MVREITDVETTPFGENAFSQSAQFINIATKITLGVFFNERVWQHALNLSLITQIWHSISGTCLLVEVLLSSIFMFVSSNLMGSKYTSIREVLILNPLLLYMDLTVPIEWVISFRFMLLMHLILMNFRLKLMSEEKGIFSKNMISTFMVMFLLDLIMYL